MKRTLFVFLCIVALFNAKAQKPSFTDKAVTRPMVNIASGEVNKMYTPPPTQTVRLKSAAASSAKINVVYVDFPEEAKNAFQVAVSIWENLITTTIPINILAKWEKLEGNTLAYGFPSMFYKNFSGAPVKDVFYPVALVEKLTGQEWSGKEPDIVCSFNKNQSWYFGSDGNTPATRYDFITAVLHEITHGLGFSGFFKAENGMASFSNASNLPSIYDYYVFNFEQQRIADENVFSRPSDVLMKQLTSQRLKFSCEESQNNKSASLPATLFAPATWQDGSSLYHLNKSDSEGGSSNLMSAYKLKGEAIHSPGENVLRIISDMGWESMSFDFETIRDFEQTCAELPVQIKISGDVAADTSSVKIIYSKDYFTSCDTVKLSFDPSKNCFSGNISVNNFFGNVQYYFIANSTANKKYSLPGNAPAKKYSFRIGPDYSVPTILHNPVKLVTASEEMVKFSAVVTDNLGVSSVVVEYKIDGVEKEPVALKMISDNVFSASLPVSKEMVQNSNFEYRIMARDASKNGNKTTVPATGLYSVTVFEPMEALNGFLSDFNLAGDDFAADGFEISAISGFSGGMMHTAHPYPVSALENENYNLVAQLKHPIILKENGKMTFDEIVLVETGETNASFTDKSFYDYVIVEGSRDGGKTWLPVTKGYDSGSDDLWAASLKSSLINNTITAAREDMFVQRTINLTASTGFYAGDTVLFRFRLSSDKSVNGWGWAIDNLKIQEGTNDEKTIAEDQIRVYPNPFSSNFFIDCSNASGMPAVDIRVTDLAGKTVFSETWSDSQFNSKKQVDLSDIKPGIYLVCMATDASQIITKKIVKY